MSTPLFANGGVKRRILPQPEPKPVRDVESFTFTLENNIGELIRTIDRYGTFLEPIKHFFIWMSEFVVIADGDDRGLWLHSVKKSFGR